MTIDTMQTGHLESKALAPPDTTTGAAIEKAVEFDAATEKRLIRKLDMRLVLLAFLCCMAQCLQRI